MNVAAGGAPGDGKDDDDDPNQVDTIVLGAPGEAPQPARRADLGNGGHAGTVHPTILVHLPRSGDQTGMIPSSEAGHLLFDWLAAFNHADFAALGRVLPTADAAVAAQRELRQETGGFSLLSAKEVEPGVLVFRLLDQSAAGAEALGTLEMRPDSLPPAIASFSLRAVPSPSREQAGDSVRSGVAH